MLIIGKIIIVTRIISVSVVLEHRQNNYLLFLNIWKEVSDYKWPSHRDVAGQWVAGQVAMASPVEL